MRRAEFLKRHASQAICFVADSNGDPCRIGRIHSRRIGLVADPEFVYLYVVELGRLGLQISRCLQFFINIAVPIQTSRLALQQFVPGLFGRAERVLHEGPGDRRVVVVAFSKRRQHECRGALRRIRQDVQQKRIGQIGHETFPAINVFFEFCRTNQRVDGLDGRKLFDQLGKQLKIIVRFTLR